MGMPPLEYKKMKKGGLPIILIQYLLHPGRCGIGIANLATQLQQLALHLFDFTGISGGIVDVMVFVGVGEQVVDSHDGVTGALSDPVAFSGSP